MRPRLTVRMTAHAPLNVAHFLSLFLTALCLGPALAHLLELPNKLSLGRDDYFTVQQIYRGWALLGVLIAGVFASTIALAWMTRRLPAVCYWVLTAILCEAAAQLVFENWQTLRVQWEYSHAVGSILTLAALVALIFSMLARTRAQA